MPDLQHELRLGGHVCGVDEAGRGPWAGPVVAAAAFIDSGRLPAALAAALDDSKKLSAPRRTALHAAIVDGGNGVTAAWALADIDEIDTLNILQATHLAMSRAVSALVNALGCDFDHALVDGNRLPALPCPATALIGGDGRSLSIAAASILAKVERDRIMIALAGNHPGYGWETNMGYGTRTHAAALDALGPTPHHRRSFAPVAKACRKTPS